MISIQFPSRRLRSTNKPHFPAWILSSQDTLSICMFPSCQWRYNSCQPVCSIKLMTHRSHSLFLVLVKNSSLCQDFLMLLPQITKCLFLSSRFALPLCPWGGLHKEEPFASPRRDTLVRWSCSPHSFFVSEVKTGKWASLHRRLLRSLNGDNDKTSLPLFFLSKLENHLALM